MAVNLQFDSAIDPSASGGFWRQGAENSWLGTPPSSPQQEALKSISQLVHRPRDSEIIREGKPVQAIYCIVSGIVSISRLGETGKCQVFTLKKQGQVFGLPEEGRYVNSARTLTAVTLCRLPWTAIKDLSLQHREVGSYLLQNTIFDLRRAQEHILALGQQNVAQRLVQFLLQLSEAPEFYDAEQGLLELKIRRSDLADYCGTSSEHVSRIFLKLEQKGLICRVSSKFVRLLDVQGLREFLNGQRRA